MFAFEHIVISAHIDWGGVGDERTELAKIFFVDFYRTALSNEPRKRVS